VESLRGNKAIFLIWLAVSALLVLAAIEPIISGIGLGPDDQLRQVQLRDWLAGQSWFDTTQYRIGVPDSQPMHWPRLIEIPLALIVLALSPMFGSRTAEIIAMTVVPLLLLGVTIWLIYKISRELFDEKLALLAAALTATAVPVLIQLRPMRIDHHGWQVVLALFALWTVFWPNKRKSGIALGLGLALLLSISLEGLPLAAGFVALIAFQWLQDEKEAPRLIWTLGTLISGIALLFFVTQGHFNRLLIYCDAVSPAQIFAALAGAAIILPACYLNPRSLVVRGAALSVGGLAAIVTLYVIEPQCVGGGFGQIDPLVRQYWLANVAEGLPIWHQDWKSAAGLFGGSIIVGLLTLGYLFWKPQPDMDKRKLYKLAYVLIFAFLVSLLVQRASATAAAIAVPLMAWAVHQGFFRARKIENFILRVFATAGVVILVMPGPLFVAAYDRLNPQDEKVEATAFAKADLSTSPAVVCGSLESLEKLNALPRTDMVVPFNLGPKVLLQTPHSVLATSHHRNDKAMADQIKIFASTPEKSREILDRHDIKYIAICPDEAELDLYEKLHPNGLWGLLSRDEKPDWLQPVHLRDSGLKTWRIVKN